MERATKDGYITHRSIHEKTIMHQPSWSYASSIKKHLGVGVINMERATQDCCITHRSIHEKIIMHQPSWSYASSITQPSWRWSYQHEKSYTRWLHQTPINTRKDYLASTFMIIRKKHNPPILLLELSTCKELPKMVLSHTDQYTKWLSSINPLDHTHQAYRNHLGVGVINIETATQDGYITQRSIYEKIIMHQHSWSYASSYEQGVMSRERAIQHGYMTHRSLQQRIIMHQPSWSYASSITQPYCRLNYKHGKSYERWLHHTPINTRKVYHASTFMIIRIKPNPTILALMLSTWKELHKMVTSHTDQYTKRLWCINFHDHTHQA